MAGANWAHAFAYVCLNEGGYVCDPADPGGATNRGVTLATLSAWRSKPCTADDVKTLSLSETQQIYRVFFWEHICGDQLVSEAVATSLFDVAVNCGVAHAAKTAQAIAGVTQDGNIGPISLKAINALAADDFVLPLVAAQHAYYLAIVRAKPALVKYNATWQKRCAGYLALLLS